MMKFLAGFLFVTTCFADVYDCFTFFNELELLEIKLNELYESVDKFVIVESVETFSGHEKPLYFLENRERFRPFWDKIIHVIVDQRVITPVSGDREHFQKNHIMKGLVGCKDSDIIIMEDLDEIVRPEMIPVIKDLLLNRGFPCVTCSQELHFWFLNVFVKQILEKQGHLGQSSVACLFSTLRRASPQAIRAYKRQFPQIPNAGWHFSYLGGRERILHKINSTFNSSGDFIEAFNRRPEEILENTEDLVIMPIDESYPKFIRDHISKYVDLGLILCP